MKSTEGLAYVSITVSDLGRIGAFYRDVLGFRRGEVSNHVIDGCSGRRLMMHLGEQSVELFQPAMPGNPYPEARTAHDPWFQHIAIVVSDIDRAHAALKAYDIEPITQGGPQLLPPSSGSVQAFKFRDPDGHPLELLQFPPRSGDPKWQERDHPTALFWGMITPPLWCRILTAALHITNR